jgi:hypothetical protein
MPKTLGKDYEAKLKIDYVNQALYWSNLSVYGGY